MRIRKQKISFSKRLQRLFNAKNIVVVSQHAVDHYTFSLRMQLLLVLGVATVIGVASYSTGRYIEARSTIAENEEVIKLTEAENLKINNEYSLLKRDLLRMTQEGDGLSDYAQFVIDQYQQPGNPNANMNTMLMPAGQDASGSKLLERINFLESEIERERFRREQFMNTIRHLTKDKIKVLEKAVEMTGMEDEVSSVLDKRASEHFANATADTSLLYSMQGGPYYPYDNSIQDQATIVEDTIISEVAYAASMMEAVDSLPLARPMKGGRYTSGFGIRIDPIRRRPANHTGIDYAGPVGSRIHATASGTVIYAGYKGAYGRTIDIDHGNGFKTRYGHLSRVLVNAGSKVKTGQVIGIQGSTGRSTGHHLHYEVRYRNQPVNPEKFVKAGHYVSQNFQ